MNEVVVAVTIMTGVGVAFATLLATADYFLRVEEDSRIEEIEALLPGNNCGACGEPGCGSFAQRLVRGEVSPAKCTVSSAEALAQIAVLLDVDVGTVERRVARLRCGGGKGLIPSSKRPSIPMSG